MIVGLQHASLSVTDLDRSRRWYVEVVGLEVAFTEESPARRAAVLRLPGDDRAVLGLVQHGSSAGASFDPTTTGLDHLAFTVGSRSDLDDWAVRLDAAGVDHSGAIDIPPGAILNFKDPDGIALALFWNR